MNKKAEVGIGTLFMFIVILLIAMIAAGVMIWTNIDYAEKTLITNKEAIKEATQAVDVIEIVGEDGAMNYISYLEMIMKVGPNSPATSFNLTYFGLSLSNSSAEFMYDVSVNCNNRSTLVAGQNYGIEYLKRGSESLEGRINHGDVVKMCFMSPRAISPAEKFKVHIVTIAGSRIIFDYQLPDLLYDNRTLLYP